MARTTYAHIVGSLATTLKVVFANAELSDLQILYWVVAGVNSVKQAELESGKSSGSYLQTFTEVPVTINYTEKDNVFAKRKFIELPANILDLTNDRAIEWICYYTTEVKVLTTSKPPPRWFERDSLTHVIESYRLPFAKPTQHQPKYVRVNNLLYLFGIEDAVCRTVDMALYTSIEPSVLTVTMDDEVFLNDEQIGKVLSYVTGLGRFMFSIPEQKTELADDTREAIPIATKQSATT